MPATPTPPRPRAAAGLIAAELPEASEELLRDAAVLVTTPPGVGVERVSDGLLRDALPLRLLGFDGLDTARLGREDRSGTDEPGPPPLDPPEEPPELDPPELDPPDELEPAVVRGTACAPSPAGAASTNPRTNVSASRVERVMSLTPLAKKAA